MKLLITIAYRVFLRAQEKLPIAPWLIVPVRATVFAIDTILSALLVLAWVLLYGLPAKAWQRFGSREEGSSATVVFLSQEGFTVAPTRIRSYFFAERIARLGVATKVLAFWDHIFLFDHLPDRPIFGVERVIVALRAAHQLLADPPAAIVQQRPSYDLITSWALNWLHGTPVIFDIDDWIGDYMWFYPIRVRHVLPKCRSLASVCVVSSRRLEQELGPWFPRLVKIPTFADTDVFRPRGSPPESREVVFGWNGTLFQDFMYEALMLMIRAFCRACDQLDKATPVAFEVAGTGAYFDLLEKTLASEYAGYPIRIKGWLDPRTMSSYLDGIDVGLYALTLPRQGEDSGVEKFILSKSPTKVFEYMAKGIPTISTRLGEVAEYIHEGVTGYSSDNVDELAAAFLELARNPDLRARMGSAARRQCAEHYSMEAAALMYARIVSDTCAGSVTGTSTCRVEDGQGKFDPQDSAAKPF